MKLKKLRHIFSKMLLVVTAAGAYIETLTADTAEIPFHKQKYTFDSGTINGNERALNIGPVSHIVSIANAPWLRLNLQGTELGPNSYLEITSLYDNATQILTSESLAQRNNQSAYFNGDAVEVKLYVNSRDKGVSLKVSEITVGEYADTLQPLSICGTDDRIASTEPRVGRMDPAGCTGWIIDGGQLLTAGHCLDGTTMDTLSFNPPPSLDDGTVQFPGPEDQYSINQSSYNFVNGGVGDDWGTFEVFNNAQTGLQPIDAQGSYSIKQDLDPTTIRITGFGVDDGTTNQTNQTHAGANEDSSGTTMRYSADTTGGNSGSPVIDDATGITVGIHSHGGCFSTGGNNSGTSFFNTALWDAIGSGTGNQAPTASYTFTCTDLSCDFDASASSDSDGTVDSYSWDFGDGNSATGSTPSHTFSAGGSFDVTLTVTDNEGASGNTTQSVTVVDPNGPTTGGFTETNLSPSAGEILSYTIDVPANATLLEVETSGGTGNVDLTIKFDSAPSRNDNDCLEIGAGNNHTCSITNPSEGTWFIVVRGAAASSGVQLDAYWTAENGSSNVTPTADFTVATTDLAATFTDTSSDSDGNVVAWSWDFGDGNTSTSQNPTHDYSAAGTYNVTLTVTDDEGATDSSTQSITVSTGGNNSGGFTETDLAPAAGEVLSFTIDVPAGATSLEIDISGGTGNADLAINFGSTPTRFDNDCIQTGTGNAHSCNITNPSEGTWFIVVRGAAAASGVQLDAYWFQ
ncbi:MAG: PKD domain-containing protein [Kangiellaceae bacterium]